MLQRYILLLAYVFSFCLGCFPNPSTDTCPTIVTGPMMTPICSASLSVGSGIVISPAAELCSVTATCTRIVPAPAQTKIQFNGGGTLYTSPKTLTCDDATGLYTYEDTAGIQQSATSVDCVCDAMTCMTILTGSAFIGSQTGPDANCIYSLFVDCSNPADMMISFLGDDFPPPKAITCPAGYTNYFYINSFSMQEEAIQMDCLP